VQLVQYVHIAEGLDQAAILLKIIVSCVYIVEVRKSHLYCVLC